MGHQLTLRCAGALLLLLSTCALTADAAPTLPPVLQRINVTQRFSYALYPPLYGNAQYYIGQDVRLALSTVQTRPNTLFNRTAAGEIRVRIISAYANETMRGPGYPVQCNQTAAVKVWAEFGELGASKAYVWGSSLVRVGTMTFSAPPFPFRVCFFYSPRKDDRATQALQRRWVAGTYSKGRTVHRVNETEIYYYTPNTTLNEGDFAAIAVARRSLAFPYPSVVPNPINPLAGDNVKLVPAGYPCTYERRASLDNATSRDYCGTNAIQRYDTGYTGVADGEWLAAHCRLEGSVTNGVAAVGTNWLNPLVSTSDAVGFPRRIQANETLVAYFKLPAAGQYDVCYSSVEYRRSVSRLRSTVASPLWFKLLRANTTCASDKHTVYTTPMACRPNRDARLVIKARHTSTPSWSMPYTPRAGAWATVQVSGTSLNTNPASKFDLHCTGSKCSALREYYRTAGGDMLRLVPASVIETADTAATVGNVNRRTAGARPKQRLLVARAAGMAYGSETLQVEVADTPDLGTAASAAGCWYAAADNYGSARGIAVTNPQFCSQASCTESGDAAVTASSDLGGEPHRSRLAASLNEANQNSSFAYLRLPLSGRYYVCYRKSGTAPWQVLPWNVNVSLPSRAVDNSSRVSTSFTLDPASRFRGANVTYYLNDTRALTLAPFELRSTSAVLTTLSWNFYNVSTDAATVGSAFRIVPNTQGCDTLFPTVESTDPGLRECISPTQIAGCVQGVPCAGCLGRRDESATLRRSVVFPVQIPFLAAHADGRSYWRICYRRGAQPWSEIPRGDVGAIRDRLRFVPALSPRLVYSMVDSSIGSWGRIRIRSTQPGHTGSLIDTYPFDGTFGTLVRLAANASGCDVTWTGSGVASDYNASFMTSDLATECQQTRTSRGPPATGASSTHELVASTRRSRTTCLTRATTAGSRLRPRRSSRCPPFPQAARASACASSKVIETGSR
jgi:hypothetical protein